MPDPLGLLIGMISIIALVVIFVYCDDLGDIR